jgi:DNA-binding NtrC family response regulator
VATDLYRWPGNVRQLTHSVERAVLLARGEAIGPADLALSSQGGASGSLEGVEQAPIRKAQARSAAKVGEAAAALGPMRMPGGNIRAVGDC